MWLAFDLSFDAISSTHLAGEHNYTATKIFVFKTHSLPCTVQLADWVQEVGEVKK